MTFLVYKSDADRPKGGPFEVGRRVKLAADVVDANGVDVPAGTLVDVLAVDGESDSYTLGWAPPGTEYRPDGAQVVAIEYVPGEDIESAGRGKPYAAGLDPKRAGFGGLTTPRAVAAPAPVASMSAGVPADVDGLLGALRAALTAKPAAAVDEGAVRDIVVTEMRPALDDILGLADNLSALRSDVAPLVDLARRISTATPTARARVALAASSSSNPILARLLEFYNAGVPTAANVVLAAPPSIGKTYAVRELGKSYDLFLEHGCTDDIDEVATLLGSPVPDGAGGFVVVDGVMTQAVRAASEGQNVLLLLDEVFRLGERAQEWLLSFLTGVKTPAGKVYRLRTRRTIGGVLEVIECPAERLHLVAATNLGARQPVEAFWSRWRVVRIPFDTATVASVAASIAASYGIADAGTLGRVFAAAVAVSRAQVADGVLRFPLDLRALEVAAQMAPTPTASAVAKLVADAVADSCAHWGVDSGETDPASAPGVNMVRSALGVA